MKRPSFFLRLFVGNLLIVVGMVTVAAAVSYRSLNAEYLRTTYAHQDHLVHLARQHLEVVWPLADAEVDRFCKQFVAGSADGPAVGPAADGGLAPRLTVIARDGRVLGDSLGDPARMENHQTGDRPEVLSALGGEPGRHVRRSETLAIGFRYVADPVRHGDEVVGVVRVAMPVLEILAGQALVRDVLVWTALMAIAAFALLGLLVNWIWYTPLKRVSEAAGRIASGDLAHRPSLSGPEELARLGSALNTMRGSLARQIATITAQRENLARVVGSLREGVIALDAADRILLMNAAAVDLLAPDETQPVGRHFHGIVRVPAILDARDRAAAEGRPVHRQIETDLKGCRRHLDVHASPMAASGGEGMAALIVVRDVSDLVRTAAVKAEFVANASHELRTPLATLRAAVDSLAADPGDAEAVAKVVAILDRHVERLERLTLDLLDLHFVEGAKQDLARETVTLASLAEGVRAQFAEAAAEKGLALDVAAAPPDASLVSDRRLLELILQNLVDNAVKFTAAAGRVSCDLERTAGALAVRVRDTGVGIRREDQPRVFERFFQADASRSGAGTKRGTGLGLAIVKHACERLGGKVTLESDLGKGTTVTVLVPNRAGA